MAVPPSQAHPTGSSRWREWVEEKLPWYSPHTERLRNVKSEIIDRIATDTTDAAQEVIDRRQGIIDDYERADAAAHVQHKRMVKEAREDAEQ